MNIKTICQTVITCVLLIYAGTTALAADNSNKKKKEKVSYIPKITGMMNLRYAYDDMAKDEHGFDIRRVRLGVKGDLHERVDYVFQAEYETTVRVIDAYLRCKVCPEFNVQVGEFKVAYSQETLGGPANWMVIEFPAAVAKLNGYNDLCGIKANGRDVGLRFYGGLLHRTDFDILRYRVGVYNGNGINTKDDNRKKDVAAMLWVSPVRQLSLTGGFYAGHYGPRHADHVRNRASAGVEWKDTKLTVRSEYLWGNTGGQHSQGAYAQVGYTIHRIVQPLLSYDYFRQDSHSGAPRQHNLQVGVNVSPIDHLRIQVAYTHSLLNNDKHRNLAEVQAVVTY